MENAARAVASNNAIGVFIRTLYKTHAARQPKMGAWGLASGVWGEEKRRAAGWGAVTVRIGKHRLLQSSGAARHSGRDAVTETLVGSGCSIK